ncbi:HET-domain-containing protein [Massarina eburnea CBS 473.64]|uniref:HET-domain-containing protein n=1 Tax=Massarina eburnea CBS 473.64 TaxID=1395130 RepID=A0A6A6SCH7_9PLEO|nr:HET-domain-containing protein [Massarina eburnea CBS 473.64]
MGRGHVEHWLFGDEKGNQDLRKYELGHGENGAEQDGDVVSTEYESDDETKHDHGESGDEHMHEIGNVEEDTIEEDSDNESSEVDEYESEEDSEDEREEDSDNESEEVEFVGNQDWDNHSAIYDLQTLSQKDREQGLKIIKGLLWKMKKRPIRTPILKAAAEEPYGGSKLLALLVRHNNTLPIHEEIVKTVANNPLGYKMMDFLLQYEDELVITEDVMIAAASVRSNLRRPKPPLEVLLERKPHVQVTENILIAAAKGSYYGLDLVALLLQHRDNIDITEKVLVAAIENSKYGVHMTRELLKRPGVTVTNATMQAAMQTDYVQEFVTMLVAHGSNLAISEDVMEQAYAKRDRYPCLVGILMHSMEDTSQRRYQHDHEKLGIEITLPEDREIQANSTPCATCLELSFALNLNDPEHDIVMKDLLRTSPGCWGCSLIQKCTNFIIKDAKQKLEPHSELRIHLRIRSPKRWLCVSMYSPQTFHVTGRTEFYRHPDSPIISPHIGIGGDISAQPSSPDCMKLVNSWLQDCIDNHKGCSSYSSILPTRVIDVGSIGVEPFLYSTSGEVAKYAALSHCWGTTKPCVTEKRSLEDRTNGIPLHTLSKTFQDAITITRKLGIRYLWIDSLCIVQDDDEDWSEEVANMSNVYRNSTVTILADGKLNKDGTCSAPLDDTSDRKISKAIPCVNKDGAECHVYSRPQMGTTDMVPHHDRYRSRELHRRGWTFQERILSPRMIHYTPDEIAWECTTQQCCECSPTPVVFGNTNNLKKRLLRDDASTCHEQWDPMDRSIQWHRLVEEFTMRKFSRDSDRLPAISGLASMMTLDAEDEYVCGLWGNNLVRELLWSIRWSSHPHDKYYAPSWYVPRDNAFHSRLLTKSGRIFQNAINTG